MSLNAFVTFNGNCREAIEFYKKVFKIKESKIMTYGEMPKSPEGCDCGCGVLPESAKKLIAYAEFPFENGKLMMSDVPPETPFVVGSNITLTYSGKDKEEIKHLFSALKKGGKVQLELRKTFWSELFGMLTDKFGINWQLTLEGECEKCKL